MASRITYRRQVSYNTINNKIRKVKTPGGRTVAQYLSKRANPRVCGEAGCRKPLTGLPVLRPNKYKLLKKRENRVSRAYGGSLCSSCVKSRIVRAFLTEEVKIVKKVMSQKKEKK